MRFTFKQADFLREIEAVLWKDYLRIGSLSAAIVLGTVLQGTQPRGTPEPEGWTVQIEGIKPVPVDTVRLPHPEKFRT
ncbi:hypothetical protein [Leisingera sp.]|uniref:hypothetical protein n=1 Tax=Leisingera sp. TaxID=1879318 RepID=UPI002B2649D2|nr:hypothetical protein [Leisingera sp.]